MHHVTITASAAEGVRPPMGYVAELDGLRALAIVLVLAFHGGWSWMSGGYVGVSLFFTLSGFLVTGLLLDEFARNGKIDVRRFLTRRMRRLLPASLACLLGVAVLATIGAFGSQPGLGRDLVGATMQLANWFSLTGDTTYAEQVLGTRSPIDHFWSLSIEEQLYWVWPLAVGVAIKRFRVTVCVVVATLVSMAAALWIAARFGPDAAYWATPARAGEVLVGASLAVLVRRGRSQRIPASGVVGTIGLVIVLWAGITWPSGSGPAYSGWLPFFAIASAAVIYSAQHGDRRSPLRSALRLPPLVGLGRISYGVYLYHWPVFLLVDRLLGREVHAAKFMLQVVVTLIVALLSYQYLERPLRNGAGRNGVVAALCLAGTVSVLVIATLGSFAPPDRFAEPAAAIRQIEPVDSIGSLAPLVPLVSSAPRDRAAATVPEVPTQAPDTAPPTSAEIPEVLGDVFVETTPARPVRILVVGDSTAWAFGDGLAAWAATNPSLAQVNIAAVPGCGFMTGGDIPQDRGEGYAAACTTLLNRLPEVIDSTVPDIVMMMVSRSDLMDQVWPESDELLTIFDPTVRARAVEQYSDLGATVSNSGAKAVWVTPLLSVIGSEEMTDPQRIDELHRIIEEAVTELGPERSDVVDLASWYATSGIDDAAARVDGVHFEVEAAEEVAGRFVGPSLVNIALGASQP